MLNGRYMKCWGSLHVPWDRSELHSPCGPQPPQRLPQPGQPGVQRREEAGRSQKCEYLSNLSVGSELSFTLHYSLRFHLHYITAWDFIYITFWAFTYITFWAFILHCIRFRAFILHFMWGCTSGGVYIPCIYSYAMWDLLFVCLCDIFQPLINSFVCWFWAVQYK